MLTVKDSEVSHRRFLAVPEMLMQQQLLFEDHHRLMRVIFEDRWPAANPPNLFWFRGVRVRPFVPGQAIRDAGDLWPFKINALRRRMRTRLYEEGAPGEVVDCWMGHWDLGNCPWMEGSGFQFGELKKLVDTFVTKILEEDGWVAIPSMLTRDLSWTQRQTA